MRHKMAGACAAVVLIALFSVTALAEQIVDQSLGFTLEIPGGFVAEPALVKAKPDFVYAFRKPGPGGFDTVLIVERMRGTIGREKLNPNVIAGTKGRLLTVQWRSFQIEAFELPEESNGIQVINYNVQVPLKHEAIQLRVIGDQAHAVELRQLVDDLLAGLQGESNWLASVAPAGIAGSSHYGPILLGAIITGVLLGLVLLWLVGRRTPRGTVLAISILIYAVSWGLGNGESREMRATVGGIRMLGFAGMLLGIVISFRSGSKRSSRQTIPPNRAAL